MKGEILGYGAILLILIIGSAVIITVTKTGTVSQSIATGEGRLITSENYNILLLRTLNQSIEFISQRAAYELGKRGGLYRSRVYWNEFYPKMNVLEKNLEDAIEEKLPSKDIKESDKEIKWIKSYIDVNGYDIFPPCGPIDDSDCFFVNGSKSFDVRDKITDSLSSFNLEIYSNVKSNYFKLLNAGRAIMEDPQLNSKLNDTGALLNELYAFKGSGDPRFDDLDFSAIVDDDVVTMTIWENCFPPDTYCLAPLYPGESGIIDTLTGKEIPYNYFELVFKYQEEQTGSTPLQCDFNIVVTPDTNSIKSGEYTQALVRVNKLGAGS